jgi:hypothetical protein
VADCVQMYTDVFCIFTVTRRPISTLSRFSSSSTSGEGDNPFDRYLLVTMVTDPFDRYLLVIMVTDPFDRYLLVTMVTDLFDRYLLVTMVTDMTGIYWLPW